VSSYGLCFGLLRNIFDKTISGELCSEDGGIRNNNR
jgi:hypothetical protein